MDLGIFVIGGVITVQLKFTAANLLTLFVSFDGMIWTNLLGDIEYPGALLLYTLYSWYIHYAIES